MGNNLSGSSINSTYQNLLKVDGGVDASFKTVSDGDGTDTTLKVSTSGIECGTIESTGGVTISDGSSPGSYTPPANSNDLVIESSSNSGMSVVSGASSTSSVSFGDIGTLPTSNGGQIEYNNTTEDFTFKNKGVTALTIDNSGKVTLSAASSVTTGIRELTATGNILADDDLVIFKGTTASQVLTLPNRTGLDGKSIRVINMSTQTVTVTGYQSQDINKQQNAVLAAPASNIQSSMTLVAGSSQSNWIVVASIGTVTIAGS
tara:strand:+ start:183 stop:965 length:783 start_codon:yes stop_codon:yes gene_type:complete